MPRSTVAQLYQKLVAMDGNRQAQELRLTGTHLSHKRRSPLHVLVRRGAQPTGVTVTSNAKRVQQDVM